MKKRLIIAVLAIIAIGAVIFVLNIPEKSDSPTPQVEAAQSENQEQNEQEPKTDSIDSIAMQPATPIAVGVQETPAPIKKREVAKSQAPTTKTEMTVALNEPMITEQTPELEPVQQPTPATPEVAEPVEEITPPTPLTHQQPIVEVAPGNEKHKTKKPKRITKYPLNKSFIHNIAILVGTDIGAATPWPLSHLLSSGDKFFGTPRIKPTAGLRYVLPLSQIWSFGVNVIYKKVCLDAITRVTNQRYYDADTEFLQYFSGTAQATMEFAMWEIPAYAKYTFPYSDHSILIGGYAAWRPKSTFESIAKKGYVGGAPDVCDGIVDSDLQMSFTKSLREFELGAMVGYEYKISRHFGIGARLYAGLTDIFIPEKRSLSYKMIPVRGSFLLSYQIFSRKD